MAGWEKKRELATMSLEFEFHFQLPCGFPMTELSDFRQSPRSGNQCCIQTFKNMCQLRVMTSLPMPFLPIIILHQLFCSRYSNSRDVVASSPSFSCPAAREPGELACRLENYWMLLKQGPGNGSLGTSSRQ